MFESNALDAAARKKLREKMQKNSKGASAPVANSAEIKRIALIVRKAKDAYYNTSEFFIVPAPAIKLIENEELRKLLTRAKGVVNDALYDKIEDYLKEIDPKNKVLYIGAPVRKEKVRLPFPMPSLNKKKPDTLEDWVEEGMHTITDKIDGVSLGIEFDGTGERKIYTRGKGIFGGDISFLADALRIPKLKKKMSVRAEVVMPTAMFKKWEKDFANPRNMVSGITNRNSIHPALAHCKVLAYQIVNSKTPQSQQLKTLKTLGFTIPWFTVTDDVSVKHMSELLEERKANAKYEVDGLVIGRDIAAKQTASNPTHMVAFKNNEAEEHAEAVVTEVLWRVTRTKVLFPRVMIKPVKLKGVTVTFASGKSGMTIKKLKIGPGAVISIARSGDVIPDIRGVIKPAKVAQLPDIAYNVVGEHFFAKEDAEDAVVQYLQFFFMQLGVENFKAATIQKVVDAGYDTVAKIFNLSEKKLVALTNKKGSQVYDDIHQDEPIELATLMYASQQFGRAMGSTRLRDIVKNIPDVLNKQHKNLTQKIDDIPGFDVKTANMFVINLPKFKAWLEDCPYEYVLEIEKEVLGSKCKGHKVLFTGFRDAELQEQIEAQGGEVVSSIGKCNILLAADPDGTSGKLDAARAKGIPIMTREQYTKKNGLK